MEADWEFEIGGDAPVIEAHWTGLIDLRRTPEAAQTLPETALFPVLADALITLNATTSPVWTAKCDVFPALGLDEFDADELDAPPTAATHATACYIDMLPNDDQRWSQPVQAASAIKRWCSRMHKIPLRSCRADLIIRHALLSPGEFGLGITAYLTACGPSAMEASVTLASALTAFAHALTTDSTVE
jgi:hypothetical protein